MLDALGINQHHDGISGTAKQHVANDYAYRMFTSVEANNQIYARLIDDIVSS